MRKIAISVISFSVIFYLAQSRQKIDRIMEDGIEVVVNHLEPYKMEDVPNSLILQQKVIIDQEDEFLIKEGLQDFIAMDVDSKGNIYTCQQRTSENHIFKFDPMGDFLTAFGKKGQGPGEIQLLTSMSTNMMRF